MLELVASGEQVDGEDIEAEGNRISVWLGDLPEVRGGHATEDSLLSGVHLCLGRREVVSGAGFNLEDDERSTVPCNKIEVPWKALGTPAAGDNGVAERSETIKRCIFAALSREEMRRQRRFTVGERAQRGVGAGFKREGELAEAHSESITYERTSPQEARYTWLCTPSTTKTTNQKRSWQCQQSTSL